MKRLVLFVATLLIALLLASFVAGELLTRPMRQTIGAPPAELQAETVQLLDASGHRIAGWFVPGRAGEGAMLLLHGVRSNRTQMLSRARWLHREGIASLLIDLPSHGESDGERISFGRREATAVTAAAAWLKQRLPQERMGAIGVSLGGASLLFAEPGKAVQAVVLESVYPTIDDAVQDRLAMRLGAPGRLLAPLLLAQLPLRLDLDAQQLRPIDAVARLRAPVVVAAGTLDQHTRWPETQALFAAAPAPKVLWPVAGAAHVDLHAFDPAAYEARLGPWLHAQLRKPSP